MADPLLQNLNIPDNAADEGMWGPLVDWPSIAIHASVMPDGKVVTYGAPERRAAQEGRIFIFWDPTKGYGPESLSISPNVQGVDSFCASATLLQSGKYIVSGGKDSARYTSLVDYQTEQVTRDQDMVDERYYGTMTKLADGRVMTTGGGTAYANGWETPIANRGIISSTPEVYREGEGWRLLGGAYSIDAFGPDSNRWWYPRQWVSPRGSVFGVSTEKMWELFPENDGSIRTIGDFKTIPNADTRPNVGPTNTAVMYAPGKVLQVGGNGYQNNYGSPSSEYATVFDITNMDNVVVRDVQPMNFRRQWANAAVLPNGEVLVTGGSQFADSAGGNAVYNSEIWNPETETWTVGAAASVYRGYHSTAALLANGAVLTSGGGVPGPVDNFNSEVYMPPYLFQRQGANSVLADRPKILSMSSRSLSYNDVLQVELSRQNIQEVSLIALPSSTHSFDSNTRRMTLQFSFTGPGVDIRMPSSRNLAPPGYYYVSVVDSNGVPSVAVIIAIDSADPTQPISGPVAGALPEITGAFTASMSARFDNPSGGQWQRIFDFGNGPGQDNVLFSQVFDTNTVFLSFWIDGSPNELYAPDAIVPGETANWRCGVTEGGTMFIEKNGARIAERQGPIPPNVVRVNKFIGRSNWGGDTPLIGSVTDFSLATEGGAPVPVPVPSPAEPDPAPAPVPAPAPAPAPAPSPAGALPEITGAFTASMSATFDNPSGGQWQRIFDFGNGPGQDNVLFSQVFDTNTVLLAVWIDGSPNELYAPDAIVPGETANWRCGVTEGGTMFIEKNGARIAERQGPIPPNVVRVNKFIGRSNWGGDTPLIGSVTDFSLATEGGAPVPAPSPAGALPEITGAFTASMSATFDNPSGGQWQRIFDFGNGPGQDNVLFSQVFDTNTVLLAVWIDGSPNELYAPDAIVPGETANWRCGVTEGGTMFIEKNGARIAERQGPIPPNVVRVNKFIGRSNWGGDTPLIGSVTDFSLAN